MNDYSNQKAEIATIKSRTVHIELSDADCSRLMEKCGEYGITVDQLLENFIGDLVYGTYSNGSDERMSANQWFERCWFSFNPENTLLKHLLENSIDPEDFINTLDALDAAVKEKEFLLSHPEECEADDVSTIENVICNWQNEASDAMIGWISKKEFDPEN